MCQTYWHTSDTESACDLSAIMNNQLSMLLLLLFEKKLSDIVTSMTFHGHFTTIRWKRVMNVTFTIQQLHSATQSLTPGQGQAAMKLVQVLISCYLDYCNSVLWHIMTASSQACSQYGSALWSSANVTITSCPHYASCTGFLSTNEFYSRSHAFYTSHCLIRCKREM